MRAQLKALDAVNLERTTPKLKPILINTGFYTSSRAPGRRRRARRAGTALNALGRVDRRARDRSREPGQPGFRTFADATRRARDAAGHRRRAARRDASTTRRRTAHRRRRRGAALAVGVGILSTLRRRELVTNAAVQIDLTVVGITIGLGIVAGVIVGLVSASPLFTMRLSSILHDGTRSRTGGRAVRATRRTLVVAQMACSFVLLVGAGLLWVSVRNLLNVNYGFAIDNVITAGVNLPQPRYTADEDARSLVNRSLDSIRRLPGVVAAGATTVVPLRGFYQSGVIIAEGYVPKPGEPAVAGGSRAGHAGLLRSGGDGARARPVLRRSRHRREHAGRLSSTNGWRGDSGAMRIPSAGASSGRRMRKSSSPSARTRHG